MISHNFTLTNRIRVRYFISICCATLVNRLDRKRFNNHTATDGQVRIIKKIRFSSRIQKCFVLYRILFVFIVCQSIASCTCFSESYHQPTFIKTNIISVALFYSIHLYFHIQSQEISFRYHHVV